MRTKKRLSYTGVLAKVVYLMVAALTLGCSPTGTERSSATAEQGAGVVASAQKFIASLDAVYVGQKVCLECHEHVDNHYTNALHAQVFRTNPRSAEQGEVCEACHGPGSRHAAETWNKNLLIGYTRNWATPIEVMNGQCLSCHQGGQRLHWIGSKHETNKIACSDCHNPMIKNSLTSSMRNESISETCYSCHPKQRAEFKKRSHMPLPEGKMSCADCHNPHGSRTSPLLKTDTVNETCYSCHAEKRGPFLWEHAPVRENCSNCHLPHGSNHDKLLVTARPFLCQQCHNPAGGHQSQLRGGSQIIANAMLAGANNSPQMTGRSCQNCHTQIHGSNHPGGAKWQR